MNEYEKELYDKLSKTFGITMKPPHIYLRYGKGKTAHLILSEIEDYEVDKTRCYFCDMPGANHETEMTIQLCGKTPYTKKIKLCYDCYCPK